MPRPPVLSTHFTKPHDAIQSASEGQFAITAWIMYRSDRFTERNFMDNISILREDAKAIGMTTFKAANVRVTARIARILWVVDEDRRNIVGKGVLSSLHNVQNYLRETRNPQIESLEFEETPGPTDGNIWPPSRRHRVFVSEHAPIASPGKKSPTKIRRRFSDTLTSNSQSNLASVPNGGGLPQFSPLPSTSTLPASSAQTAPSASRTVMPVPSIDSLHELLDSLRKRDPGSSSRPLKDAHSTGLTDAVDVDRRRVSARRRTPTGPRVKPEPIDDIQLLFDDDDRDSSLRKRKDPDGGDGSRLTRFGPTKRPKFEEISPRATRGGGLSPPRGPSSSLDPRRSTRWNGDGRVNDVNGIIRSVDARPDEHESERDRLFERLRVFSPASGTGVSAHTQRDLNYNHNDPTAPVFQSNARAPSPTGTSLRERVFRAQIRKLMELEDELESLRRKDRVSDRQVTKIQSEISQLRVQMIPMAPSPPKVKQENTTNTSTADGGGAGDTTALSLATMAVSHLTSKVESLESELRLAKRDLARADNDNARLTDKLDTTKRSVALLEARNGEIWGRLERAERDAEDVSSRLKRRELDALKDAQARAGEAEERAGRAEVLVQVLQDRIRGYEDQGVPWMQGQTRRNVHGATADKLMDEPAVRLMLDAFDQLSKLAEGAIIEATAGSGDALFFSGARS